MQTSDLLLLYDYNYWANRRILDTAARAGEAQLDQAHNWGSVHGTLVHTLSAEWIWRVRCAEGVSPTVGLRHADLPTLEAVRLRWEAEEQAMRSFLAGLGDADLTPHRRVQEHARPAQCLPIGPTLGACGQPRHAAPFRSGFRPHRVRPLARRDGLSPLPDPTRSGKRVTGDATTIVSDRAGAHHPVTRSRPPGARSSDVGPPGHDEAPGRGNRGLAEPRRGGATSAPAASGSPRRAG